MQKNGDGIPYKWPFIGSYFGLLFLIFSLKSLSWTSLCINTHRWTAFILTATQCHIYCILLSIQFTYTLTSLLVLQTISAFTHKSLHSCASQEENCQIYLTCIRKKTSTKLSPKYVNVYFPPTVNKNVISQTPIFICCTHFFPVYVNFAWGV